VNDYTGQIIEIQLERYKNASALIRLPAKTVPGPGQYLQANLPGNSDEVLPTSLFLSGLDIGIGSAAKNDVSLWGNLPDDWEAGSSLAFRGPLGTGFSLPKDLKRLALIAAGKSSGRLLPLIAPALQVSAEITIFSDKRSANLPLEVEQRPLDASAEARNWADFLAIDIPSEQAEGIADLVGLDRDFPGKIRGQVLLSSEMPCGALAQCGICSVRIGSKDVFVCENGPVFSLSEFSF